MELPFTAPCIVCFSMVCEKFECLLNVEVKKEISGFPMICSSCAPMAISFTIPDDIVIIRKVYFKFDFLHMKRMIKKLLPVELELVIVSPFSSRMWKLRRSNLERGSKYC
jgi:hypothetical protein